MSIQNALDKIEDRYNPEFDLPQGNQPPVTWAEAELTYAIKELLARVERLEEFIMATRGNNR